jgi:hypothetical protein
MATTFKGASKGVKIVKEDQGKMLLEIDLTGDYGVSSSGKTIGVAGAQIALDNGTTVGLNVYKKNLAFDKKAAK